MFNTEVLKEAIDNGKYIGSGAARQAMQVSEKVVAKICIKHKTLQSQHEIAFYEKYEKSYGQFLAKMYGYFNCFPSYGTVLFMERVEPINQYLYNFLEKVYEPLGDKGKYEMEHLLEQINDFEEAVDIRDSSNNSGNWGVNEEGNLVLLDCGISGDYDLGEFNTWYNGYEVMYGGGDNNCTDNCDYCPFTYCPHNP